MFGYVPLLYVPKISVNLFLSGGAGLGGWLYRRDTERQRGLPFVISERRIMANFSRAWVEEVVLPDGSIASSAYDIECWLKRSGCALAGDYSDNFRKNVRYQKQKELKRALFADFINNYKRWIWNEK